MDKWIYGLTQVDLIHLAAYLISGVSVCADDVEIGSMTWSQYTQARLAFDTKKTRLELTKQDLNIFPRL